MIAQYARPIDQMLDVRVPMIGGAQVRVCP